MFSFFLRFLPSIYVSLTGFSVNWLDFPIEFCLKATKNGSFFTWFGLGDSWIEIESVSTTRTKRYGTKWGNFTISSRTLFDASIYRNED